MATKTNNNFSRRNFLKTAIIPAAFTIVPSSVFGINAPSNKINIGLIGTGNMGGSNLRGFLGKSQVKIVAVCDVDKSRRDTAKIAVDQKYGNTDCKAYNDFREITRRSDIDAVCISTPDHWHTIPGLDAMRHEKDAYIEKPLTLTIKEGRMLADTAKKYGRIIQTGSMQRSNYRFRYACELVRNGRIGRLQKVEVTIPGNNRECEPTWSPMPIPDGFDYDLWLGPATWQPYHEQRCHYQFRFILDYSGGQVTNWGAHYLDIAQWGLDADDSGPVEILGRGQFPTSGLFTTATKVDFECTYDNGVHLTCKTGGSGTKFIGTDGWIFVNRGTLLSSPDHIIKEPIKPDEIHLINSNDHKLDFINSIYSRTQPITNVEVGHRSASVCHLGNIGMLLKRKLYWNPDLEEFVNDDEANSMLLRPPRAPWGYTA
jgi:predicted dehydrogenase